MSKPLTRTGTAGACEGIPVNKQNRLIKVIEENRGALTRPQISAKILLDSKIPGKVNDLFWIFHPKLFIPHSAFANVINISKMLKIARISVFWFSFQ